MGQPEVGCGFKMSLRAFSCCKGAGAVCGAIPPHAPTPKPCYCLCCIFKTERRASFFLITFNQWKKNQGRQDICWIGSGILQPGSLLQFSCLFIQIYLNYDTQHFPLPLWLLYRLPMVADFAVLQENIFPPFSFIPIPIFFFQQLA